MFLYIGISAVLFAAALLSREYSRYMKKRLAECEAYLAFIGNMKIQVGCFMRPLSELCENFSSDALEKTGFTAALRAEKNIYAAYKASESALSLSEDEKEVLRLLFSSVGECYLSEGVKIIDAAYAKMDGFYRELKSECPRSTKLVSVLSATLAVGFLILVI